MRQRIYSGGPLEKKVGYCRATRVGDLVFVSGSTAMKDGQVVWSTHCGPIGVIWC